MYLYYYDVYISPAPGYPIDNKHPSLPSKTAGITSDKAEAHTSSWKINIKNYYVSQFCDFIINNKCEVTAYASQENIKKIWKKEKEKLEENFIRRT